ERVVGISPGLTLLLDVPVEVGLARARERGGVDRIEAEDTAFFERVRAGYRERAAAEPGRFRVIDASRPADEVAAAAARHLDDYRRSVAWAHSRPGSCGCTTVPPPRSTRAGWGTGCCCAGHLAWASARWPSAWLRACCARTPHPEWRRAGSAAAAASSPRGRSWTRPRCGPMAAPRIHGATRPTRTCCWSAMPGTTRRGRRACAPRSSSTRCVPLASRWR